MNMTLLEEYKTVAHWLGRYSESNRHVSSILLYKFLEYLRENGGELVDFTPDQLVEFQRNAGNGDKYKILDVVQAWINSLDLRHSSKRRYMSAVRGFFSHNRAELPRDPAYRIRSDKLPVRGTLTVEEIKSLVLSSNMTYQAVYLCMFQGGMGREEFIYWSNNGWEQLKEDLKGDPEVIRLYLPGRKMARNIRPYYTFIGPDAIKALRNWIPHRPEGSTAIFTNQFGEPLTSPSIQMQWTRQLVTLGIVTRVKNGGPGVRHGKNIHEMRDVWRSLWSKSPADHRVAEYIMGHVVDPLGYDKSFDDEGWTRKEYFKALPMLQVLSSGRPFGLIEEEGMKEDLAAAHRMIKELEGQLEVERMAKNVYEAKTTNLEAGLEAIIIRLAKLEEAKNQS
jgi:integrase